MPNLENLSFFGAVDLPSIDQNGEELLVICVAGRFDLPRAGRLSGVPPPSEEQRLPVMEDVYWGKAGASSLRYEGQTAYRRWGTDIYVSGHAWAPRGRPVADMPVEVRVGPCDKRIHVFGPRVWYRGLMGLTSSAPLTFESMPLRYERSFGGASRDSGRAPVLHEPCNPVGVGLYSSVKEAIEQPLPNLEDPHHLLSSPLERVTPVGVGPIARSWQPRLRLAGTYDETWVERTAPLWPDDFNPRFFNAAAAGLIASAGLNGGEEVLLTGLSPDGQIAFVLPHHRLMVKSVFRHRADRRELRLDAVQLEPDERTLTLIWRATIPAHRELSLHEYSLIRELEPWEDMPS